VSFDEVLYDEKGRAWRTIRHKIDAVDGSDDDNLLYSTWYDPEGQVIKKDGEQLEKATFDRLGRQTHQFALAEDDDGSTYTNMDDVAGDIVLVEHQTTYDSAGNAVMVATIERYHDDYGGGETTGALDTNADADSLMFTAANIEGRIQITGLWYDALDRQEDSVEFGTYGGSNFDRDGMSVPARSDTALRTTRVYNDDGTLKENSDPKALETRYEYDALGRQTKVIANYDDGTPGGTDGDEDQTVVYAYTDGLRTSITADLPSGETDQLTTYTFGTVKGGSAGDSKIATGHLLKEAEYPDSTGPTDLVTYAYNAQGEEIYKKDQAGNVYETAYDTGGKRTHLRVTTLGSGFDGAVLRISTTYTSLGQRELVTQYDNATVGSGAVVDEVKFTYDGWGNLTKFEQDRNSAVGGGADDYEVSYAYEKATTGRNTLRRTSMTLPNGTATTFAYLSTGSLHDDVASRVTRVKIGDTILSGYQYNGLDSVVGTLYDEPDVMWKLSGSTGTYPDLDRFNRVTSSRWTKDLATDKDFYDTDIAWDRNSNVTSVDEQVHAGFDVLYSNDELNRLKRAEEGTLSGGSISSRKRDQQWTLTQTGNWELDKVDLNGDGDFIDANELNDDRTHNDVNELTARDTDDNGSNNYTLVYDAAGNLTDDGESYEYEWDAFYRLRRVKKTTDQGLVAEHKYNGLGYRISVHEDTDADGDVDANDKWFHSAYDERWRMVATYRESDSNPKEQFVNHNAGLDGYGTGSYIDLVVLRDKDANTAWTSASDGTLEQRLYYCQNWRADVVALVASGGSMSEWVKYSAYGVPFGLPGGDTDSDGDCDATDVTQVQTWIDGSAYDVRGDIDLDGDVDAGDKSTIQGSYTGRILGYRVLSASIVSNRKGLTAYEYSVSSLSSLARHRHLDHKLGRWLNRDPEIYADSLNAYEYVQTTPISRVDPAGNISIGVKDCPPDKCTTGTVTSPGSSSCATPWAEVIDICATHCDGYCSYCDYDLFVSIEGKDCNKVVIQTEPTMTFTYYNITMTVKCCCECFYVV
jgi:RHS repeat-associated protein